MPAMPSNYQFTEDGEVVETIAANGLTKREHFAGLAMQGLMSADTSFQMSRYEVAFEAVKQADALLAELEDTK